MSAPGIVYLLHFLQSYHHARHYLGATGLTLDARISGHRTGDTGRPAKLIRALLDAGGEFIVARVWELPTRAEAFALEKRLKARGSRARWCPLCSPRIEWPIDGDGLPHGLLPIAATEEENHDHDRTARSSGGHHGSRRTRGARAVGATHAGVPADRRGA